MITPVLSLFGMAFLRGLTFNAAPGAVLNISPSRKAMPNRLRTGVIMGGFLILCELTRDGCRVQHGACQPCFSRGEF